MPDSSFSEREEEEIEAAEDAKDAEQRKREPSNEANEMSREAIGAAIAVHRALGPGYQESIYERALVLELEHRRIAFERQVVVPIVYRGILVGEHRLDLLVGGLVIVEVKAVTNLADLHTAQAVSYLRSTNLEVALLMNFNARTLMSGLKRVIRPS